MLSDRARIYDRAHLPGHNRNITPTQSHKKPGFYSGCFAEEGGWRGRGGGELIIFAPSSREAMPHRGTCSN